MARKALLGDDVTRYIMSRLRDLARLGRGISQEQRQNKQQSRNQGRGVHLASLRLPTVKRRLSIPLRYNNS